MIIDLQIIDEMSCQLQELPKNVRQMAILSTEYLDLAFVSEDPAQNERIKAVLSSDYLDLASLPITKKAVKQLLAEGKLIVKNLPANGFRQDRFIMVPNGKVTIVDNFKLQLLGPNGQFLFFPNLPLELRTKICELDLPRRLLHAIEVLNPDGIGSHYVVIGAYRPAICMASKQAESDLTATKYAKMLQTVPGGRRLYFHPKLDVLRIDSLLPLGPLDSNYRVRAPRMALPAVRVHDGLGLSNVQCICMDLFTFMKYLSWARANTGAMVSLKEIHLSVVIPTLRLPKSAWDMVKFKKSEEGFTAEYTRDNVAVYGVGAFDTFSRNVDDICFMRDFEEWSGLLHTLNDKLHECTMLKSSGLPDIVKVIFRFEYLPGVRSLPY
ncbi:uncharacterized protein LY89DRAFT_665214 [Mollisia scopiformis]|uniref:2EXR domain-containing protein n=1 Tax=Mollisia scopiformis TaxID=149040 RepID=A0A194XPF7_MOLSC|nr:uncharacterized protein LY89DRAFT_665214 [Mollisia scopiformis]KUJ22073.1 hypothetical protein LY89DRAFT_665214 [Mollisia scopiformis]